MTIFTPNQNASVLVRRGNVALSSFGVLLCLVAASHVHWHFSNRNIILGSIDLFWFLGALALLLRWGIGWVICLFGTGTWVLVLGSFLIESIPSVFSFGWLRQHNYFVFSILGFIMAVGLFWTWFYIHFWLFIGLIRMRRELAFK